MREISGYRFQRRLGRGAAGEVWLATDPQKRQVALKLLHPLVAETGRERLLRETTALNRIQGAGVARVLDLELDDEQPFIVYELVEGVTLADDVHDKGPWELPDLADLAERLESVISAIHSAGVVHRDIKPSNVMISPAGPVLIDFGIAMFASDERLTQTGQVSGTPGYLPPEVLRGGTPDEDADWWAYAAVLAYCACGAAPFGTGSLDTVLTRVLSGEPQLREVQPPLARLLKQALDPDTARRLPPRELGRQLAALADGEQTARIATEEYEETPVTRVMVARSASPDVSWQFAPEQTSEPDAAHLPQYAPIVDAQYDPETLQPTVPPRPLPLLLLAATVASAAAAVAGAGPVLFAWPLLACVFTFIGALGAGAAAGHNTLLRSPLYLVESVAVSAVATVFGVLLATLGWVTWNLAIDGTLKWRIDLALVDPQGSANATSQPDPTLFALFVITALSLLAAWLMPFSRLMRRGARSILRTLLASIWLRALVVVVLLLATVGLLNSSGMIDISAWFAPAPAAL